jgi:hypothetical protein
MLVICCAIQNGQLQCDTGLGNSTDGIPDNAPSLPLYTCRVVEHHVNGTWIPHGDSIMPDFAGGVNGTQTVYYNQLATLLFSTGK